MGTTADKRQHRKEGICTDCSKPAAPGKSKCYIHEATHNQANKKYRLKNREKISEKNREIREQYKKKGQCPGCSKPLDAEIDKGCIYCFNCRYRFMAPRYFHPLTKGGLCGADKATNAQGL